MEQNTNTTSLVTTDNDNRHVTDGPLTTAAIREGSPSLLLNEIDRRIVKVRPMSTPVDQISRMVGSRKASSMIVDYYSVETKPGITTTAKPAELLADMSYDDKPILKLFLKNAAIFSATDTLMIPRINTPKDKKGMVRTRVFYVVEQPDLTEHSVKVVNTDADNITATETAAITQGLRVVRMGRAASELDVQTPQFEALPVKAQNYCQIFKAQVEQSLQAKLNAKDVGWTFSDQEEVAIMDMRMGMEKNFLFGIKMRFTDPAKYDEVLFTEGIWNQAANEVALTVDELRQENVIELMRRVFTGEAAGSPRKILIAGSALIEALNKLSYTKVIAADDTVTRWGIDFNELRSKFGTLYVVHSEVFDQCGHESDGMELDPQYMSKYTHIPFKVDHLDLKKSGQRNTDALVATEASCLVLRHPKSHFRVIGQ